MVSTRTDEDSVRTLIESDTDIDLTPFIETAANLVSYVSSQDTDSLLSNDMLASIELWLAAHYYSARDQGVMAEATEAANAKYMGKYDLGFDATRWGQAAKRLDVTGTLAKLDQQAKEGKQKAALYWLGEEYD